MSQSGGLARTGLRGLRRASAAADARGAGLALSRGPHGSFALQGLCSSCIDTSAPARRLPPRAAQLRRLSSSADGDSGGLAFDPSRLSPLMADIRSRINASAVARGCAPSAAELARDLGVPERDVREALDGLAELHALVLHPRGDHRRAGEVWVAHPFAFFPTSFEVEFGSDRRRVRSPCIWCSLGVAAALHQARSEDCVIHTCTGGDPERPVSIPITAGRVAGGKALWKAHFVVPAREAWGNVIHTCANMLAFEDERAIDVWCARWGEPKGDVRSLEEAMDMAAGWYGHYLEAPWRKLSPTEVRDLFKRTGFDNDFWSLS
uniref:Alkylmercury lyase n=1 Tax=Alexandrium monilatum TaxID=311494 RepID=A0A7S4Q6V6_9DINO